MKRCARKRGDSKSTILKEISESEMEFRKTKKQMTRRVPGHLYNLTQE
ncbi:hypothetical protein BH09BAC3_BH09BAC3_19550 [soil metagenome]